MFRVDSVRTPPGVSLVLDGARTRRPARLASIVLEELAHRIIGGALPEGSVLPTEPVLGLLKVTGDWQKFKGLPGAEGTLRPQPVKADKRALYEAAIAAIGADDGSAATTPRRRAARPAEPAAETGESAAENTQA